MALVRGINETESGLLDAMYPTPNAWDSARGPVSEDYIKKNPTTQISLETGTFEKQQTWWQTQSELCGVPNGVSHELHSDRANRIKALGNSIVPQIAEQIFRSIIDND